METKKKLTHLDVREDAERLKNVASDSEATAFASMVFPLPGGPNKSRPANKDEMFSPLKEAF